MANVTIYDGDVRVKFEDINLHQAVVKYYGGNFPDGAKLFKGECALSCDITPTTPDDILSIDADNGDYYVLSGFQDPVTIFTVASAVISVAVSVFSLLAQPSIPSLDNSQAPSSNNTLSDRRNRLRPNARIPDIFGRVRAIPDLISVPIRTFINNREVETALMCLGRGSYQVDEIRDGSTLVSDINDAAVEIYRPFTSPNNSESDLRIGNRIPGGVTDNRRLSAVNGQTLLASNNVSSFLQNVSANFLGGTVIFLTDVSQSIVAGDIIEITARNVLIQGSSLAFDLSGSYSVLVVSGTTVSLDNPQLVNPNWVQFARIPSAISGLTVDTSASSATAPNVIGPFETRLEGADTWICNFTAPNGVFEIGEDGQARRSVDFDIRITPIDASGADIGPTETFRSSIVGNAESRSLIGRTVTINPSFTGFARIEAERLTLTDFDFEGTVSDQIVWRDLFFTAPVERPHFGNVTLVHSRSVATEQAAGIADRELNMIATREVPRRIGNTNTFTEPQATDRADDILVALVTDPFIGRVDIDEVDIDGIYRTVQELEDYYGSPEAVKFCITLDVDNLSIQETLNIMANVIGIQPYRIGRILSAIPIIATSEAAMVFNHRNKMPKTDVIRDRFGVQSDIDGVRLQFVDDRDYVTRQFNIPEAETAENPRTVSGVGIGNVLQAYHSAWRARNTDLYQVGTHEFGAMPEAQLLIRGQNILAADNTRSERFDGDVIAIDGLTLTLSQSPDLKAGTDYSITVQHSNLTSEVVPIASHDGNRVTLTRVLSRPLFLQDGGVFKPPYVITGEDNSFVRPLRVINTTPDTDGMTRVEGAVYTPLVHLNDAITIWYRDGLEDFGPFIGSPNAAGAIEVEDAQRGTVIQVDDGGSLSPDLQQVDNHTFAAWVQASDLNLDIKTTGGGFIQSRGGALTFTQNGASITSGNVAAGSWVHVATVFEPVTQSFKAYVDGAIVGSQSATPETSPIQIGGMGDFLIDDVRLYRRAMGDDEIKAMFLATRR